MHDDLARLTRRIEILEASRRRFATALAALLVAAGVLTFMTDGHAQQSDTLRANAQLTNAQLTNAGDRRQRDQGHAVGPVYRRAERLAQQRHASNFVRLQPPIQPAMDVHLR